MASMEKFKLSALTWDSDKNPAGFNKWMMHFSSLVRATEHGPELEDFLDAKLDRRRSRHATVPSFIAEDDDFAPVGLADTTNTSSVSADTTGNGDSGDSESGTVQTTSSGRGSGRALNKAGKKLHEMDPKVQEFDQLLYNILSMNVKGTKNELLRHVSFPSYVQGMCILSKHIDICQTGRKTKAFDSMDELQFKGDIQQYQIEAVSKIQELFDSKANIVDYALSKVMKSFEGKSKTIQYRIADDINTTQDTSTLNIFDMVQGY